MATNNFKLKITTQDSDGNTASETVGVNSGPSESTPPIVAFAFPSGVRVEAGDNIDPFWGAGTTIAAAFCKVFPTARPDEGGDGTFLVQAYSTAAKYPNSPDTRFEQTFKGVGGQLTAILTNTATNFMTVSSGIGITGSGLVQSSDLVGLRKAIKLTSDAIATSTNINIGDEDEGISAYNHDTTNNRVYTLERGNRAFGRPTKTWPIGTNVTLHPYHYVPMYSNAGASDIQVQPHIMVQEVGTQYPLTGQMDVTGTSVVGTNTDFLNEISGGIGTGSYHVSGATNLIKFGDAVPWYVISGVLSSSGIVIYNYGDTLALTDQPAQINSYTLGSGTISIQPDLTGCSDWNVRITPQYSTGDSIPSLLVGYTATIESTVVGGAISGTPSYMWEVLSGTVGVAPGPTWSGLNPGNAATQTVVYVASIDKRIRVTVSGSGQPTCTHQYDTGNLSLIDGVSAGTWKSVQTTAVGTGGEVESKIRAELVGSRLAAKYYHHHLTAMKPMQTKITSITASSASAISVTAGTIDTWPNKGTVIIKGPLLINGARQSYLRFKYTGKTNSSLTGCSYETTYLTWVGNRGYDQWDLSTGSAGTSASSGSDIWIQQMQPHPFTKIEAIIAPNKIRVRDVAGISNGSSIKWIRFGPAYDDLAYANTRGGKMFDQPYRVTLTNNTTREFTLDRNLHSAIKADMICIMQPFTDKAIGLMYPSSININRLNFWGLNSFFVWNPNFGSAHRTTITTGTGVDLYIWDPMFNIIGGRSLVQQRLRIPPTGRMIFPRGQSTSSKGVVIEYNGVDGPLYNLIINGISNLSPQPGVLRLSNVKIVAELSADSNPITVGPRTVLMPYQDMEITPISIISFEPTDADIGFNFNGGTSRHLGWSQPLADQIFVTNSIDLTSTNQSHISIPERTNYEEQHFSEWPTKAIRSAPPVYINAPLIESPDDFPNGGGGGTGCIHYNTIVEVWNGKDYDEVQIKDVKIGQKIHTPDGPKEVTDRIESRHGKTHIITIADGRAVHCTDEHPIATLYDGKIVWRKAMLIEQGEEVMTDMGPQTVNANIRLSFTGRTIHPFYDLTVVDIHQFYANGILVHNKAKQLF